MDRRMLPGLVAGLAGMALGVAAAVFGVALLGIGAAACALVAGGATVHLLHGVQQAERQAQNDDSLIFPDLDELNPPPVPSVIDDDTGLPDARFFELALEGRVASARRHLWPVTLVLMELWIGAVPVGATAIGGGAGAVPTAADAEPDQECPDPREVLGDFALLLRRTLREADVACRVADSTFGLILEDTSEEGGVWTAERIQIGLARSGVAIRRMAAGVASYPTHAMRADNLLVAARAALDRACAATPDAGLGQVEVAHTELA